MDAGISVSAAGAFRRVLVSLSDSSGPVECSLSAVITSPSGREEIFLPSPDRAAANATYPYSGGRFVTPVGRGRYQIVFQPQERGEYRIRIMGMAKSTAFHKDFQISV